MSPPNLVRQVAKEYLTGIAAKPVSADQIELRRLRVELHGSRWNATSKNKCVVHDERLLCAGGSMYDSLERRKDTDLEAISSKRLSYAARLAHIETAHAASKNNYGWPRIW